MTSMSLYPASLALWIGGGILALFCGKQAMRIGATTAVAGAVCGVIAAAGVLTGDTLSFWAAWQMPFANFHLTLDPLAAVFLIPILLLCAAASIYAVGYLGRADSFKTRLSVCLFHLLVASMCLVVTARHAVLFLAAWEIMALTSFFLVLHDAQSAQVRRAGWMYLVASQIGTGFIVVLFLWIGRETGSLDFDSWTAAAAGTPGVLSAWFILAVIGFGTKAGFWPLHVWLPEAHPAAPSHVSAVMSGVMIKTGIYGLLRMLTFFGQPPVWWGIAILGIGIVSGVMGVLFALAQHDLKRLLAYHSVENIGIIALGVGTGLIGRSFGMPDVAALGFAGAILHVTNHALFKGLLFLGAGGVMHATGTRNIESLGGLFKTMPVTGTTFLIGSAAISGLPPFNGFVSEFLIYAACFKLALSGAWGGAIGGMVIAALALIGGLAAACFAKAFGVVFLGEPRAGISGHEPAASMTGPMTLLAAACVAIGVLPFAVVQALPQAILAVAGPDADAAHAVVSHLSFVLTRVAIVLWLFMGLALLFALIRKSRLASKPVTAAVTWDCGYSKPTARMQYTAGSFAQPLTELFRMLLQPHERRNAPRGHFPADASYESHTGDVATDKFFTPLFELFQSLAVKCQWIQHGWIQGYLLYIFATLAILLVWGLR